MEKRSSTGPDFARCGRPVDWTDAAPLDDRFPAAIDLAYAQRGVDIELCRWSPDDPLTEAYASWWTGQRAAIRRYNATTERPADTTLVIQRRTDRGDGQAKCYVRVDRKRARLRSVAS